MCFFKLRFHVHNVTVPSAAKEHCHSYVNRMLTKSFYKLKNVNSKNASNKQHNGILKINAFGVKINKS